MLTTILALWGALLSSIAVGWNLYRDLSEKGKLRVTCYVGCTIEGGKLDPNKYLFWNVTNIGRTSILVKSIGGKNKDDTAFFIKESCLPKMLKPGEYIIESVADFSVLSENLKSLNAYDSLGREFKASRKQVEQLKKDYERGKMDVVAN